MGHLSRLFPIFFVLCISCGKENIQTMSGQVDTADIRLSDGPTFDFGLQAVDASVEKEFTVSNIGKAEATAMSSTFYVSAFNYKGGSYPGIGGTCGATLGVAGSCSIVIVYNPKYESDYSEPVKISYNNGVASKSTENNLSGRLTIKGKCQ